MSLTAQISGAVTVLCLLDRQEQFFRERVTDLIEGN